MIPPPKERAKSMTTTTLIVNVFDFVSGHKHAEHVFHDVSFETAEHIAQAILWTSQLSECPQLGVDYTLNPELPYLDESASSFDAEIDLTLTT
jgi:hypothetical protein